MNFELTGHECPTAEYPGPVIPIGNLDGRRVASFRTQEGSASFEPVESDALFVMHADDLRLKLQSYDVERDVLFAFSESDVTWYAVDDERAFFEGVLRDSLGAGRSVEDPFFRLSLAAATGYPDAVFRELVLSARAISERCPGFLGEWYGQIVSDLESKGLHRGNWPRDPTDLLVSTQAELPISARRIFADFNGVRAGVSRAIEGLREVVLRSDRKGPAAELAKLLVAHTAPQARVLFAGARRSAVRDVLIGLLRDGSAADASWDDGLIPQATDDHAIWVTFGTEPEVVTRTSIQVGVATTEVRIPSPLCALGFQFVEVAPSLSFVGELWHPMPVSVDLCVYVEDGADNLRLRIGGALRASHLIQSVAGSRFRPAGYFDRAISGLARLEQSLARQALKTLYLPKVVGYVTASLRVGSEHRDHLQTLLEGLRSEQAALDARIALVRQQQLAAETHLAIYLSALRAELEASLRADFQLLVSRCKDIAVAAVREWTLLPGNVVPALFWFQRTALMVRIDNLLSDTQRRIDSSIAEFRAAPLSDRTLHPHTAARTDAIAERLGIVSERRFQAALFQRYEGIRLDLRPRAGEFAHWGPPVVGITLRLAKDSFLEWLRAYVGSLGYWATTQIALRDVLLHGRNGTSGMLESIDAWASASEARIGGEVGRGLEEFGGRSIQEMGAQADSVQRAYESASSEGQQRTGEVLRELDECEGWIRELRRLGNPETS